MRFAVASHYARLRPAQKLVAGEEHQIGAGSDALLRGGFVGQAELFGIQQAATAHIVQNGQATALAQFRQFAGIAGVGEAFDAEVAGVDFQQRSGIGCDG